MTNVIIRFDLVHLNLSLGFINRTSLKLAKLSFNVFRFGGLELILK